MAQEVINFAFSADPSLLGWAVASTVLVGLVAGTGIVISSTLFAVASAVKYVNRVRYRKTFKQVAFILYHIGKANEDSNKDLTALCRYLTKFIDPTTTLIDDDMGSLSKQLNIDPLKLAEVFDKAFSKAPTGEYK